MTIRNVLVHIDDGDACEKRVGAAAKLALQHEARLTGIYVVRIFFIPAYVDVQISSQVIESTHKEALEHAREAQSRAEKIAADAGIGMTTLIEEGDVISTLRDRARYADLLVIGQTDTEDPDGAAPGLADHLILEAGTPCLVVPYVGVRDTLGQRVLVAWNATRESARAVRDAIPLLQQAERVDVLTINSKRAAMRDDGAEITDHLRQHGIKAVHHFETADDISAGDLILSRAADVDADMIVMGAYGHSRIRELVLGGVTRHLLGQMTVPVLLSH